MDNQELDIRMKNIFAKSLSTDMALINDQLSYRGSEVKWDSILHMVLISEIENEFGIMLDTQDIVDMSNFAKAKEIVLKYL